MTRYTGYAFDTEYTFESLMDAEDFAEENDGILCDAFGEPIF